MFPKTCLQNSKNSSRSGGAKPYLTSKPSRSWPESDARPNPHGENHRPITPQNWDSVEANPWHQKGNPQDCLVYDAFGTEPRPDWSALGDMIPRDPIIFASGSDLHPDWPDRRSRGSAECQDSRATPLAIPYFSFRHARQDMISLPGLFHGFLFWGLFTHVIRVRGIMP